MDFLTHREGGMVFYQVFLLSPLQKLLEVKIKLSRQSWKGNWE
jgi:hypothetical protein